MDASARPRYRRCPPALTEVKFRPARAMLTSALSSMRAGASASRSCCSVRRVPLGGSPGGTSDPPPPPGRRATLEPLSRSAVKQQQEARHGS